MIFMKYLVLMVMFVSNAFALTAKEAAVLSKPERDRKAAIKKGTPEFRAQRVVYEVVFMYIESAARDGESEVAVMLLEKDGCMDKPCIDAMIHILDSKQGYRVNKKRTKMLVEGKDFGKNAEIQSMFQLVVSWEDG